MAGKAFTEFYHECHFCAKLFSKGEPGYLTEKEARKANLGFAGYGNCGQHPESAAHLALVIYKDFKPTGEVVWVLPEDMQKCISINHVTYAPGVALHVGRDYAVQLKPKLLEFKIIPKRY